MPCGNAKRPWTMVLDKLQEGLDSKVSFPKEFKSRFPSSPLAVLAQAQCHLCHFGRCLFWLCLSCSAEVSRAAGPRHHCWTVIHPRHPLSHPPASPQLHSAHYRSKLKSKTHLTDCIKEQCRYLSRSTMPSICIP